MDSVVASEPFVCVIGNRELSVGLYSDYSKGKYTPDALMALIACRPGTFGLLACLNPVWLVFSSFNRSRILFFKFVIRGALKNLLSPT